MKDGITLILFLVLVYSWFTNNLGLNIALMIFTIGFMLGNITEFLQPTKRSGGQDEQKTDVPQVTTNQQ